MGLGFTLSADVAAGLSIAFGYAAASGVSRAAFAAIRLTLQVKTARVISGPAGFIHSAVRAARELCFRRALLLFG
jgi:hypothetical protein